MSGLYTALTDEHLPGGRLEARAEGNALGKGPVVFEVHQSAVEIIRKLAARELHLASQLPMLIKIVHHPEMAMDDERLSLTVTVGLGLLSCHAC